MNIISFPFHGYIMWPSISNREVHSRVYNFRCKTDICGDIQTINLIKVKIDSQNHIFVEVDFLWNRTVDSLKTSFHLLLQTSSGLKE